MFGLISCWTPVQYCTVHNQLILSKIRSTHPVLYLLTYAKICLDKKPGLEKTRDIIKLYVNQQYKFRGKLHEEAMQCDQGHG